MALSDLLSSAQGKPVGTTTKPVSNTGGLSSLLNTATPQTVQKQEVAGVRENPRGSGYPAIMPDGTEYPQPTSTSRKSNFIGMEQSPVWADGSPVAKVKDAVVDYVKQTPRLGDKITSPKQLTDIMAREAQPTWDDAKVRIDKAIEAWNNPEATKLEKGTRIGEATLGGINGLLSGVTATLKAAEGIPGVGKLAYGLNTIFGAVGAGASTIAGGAVDNAPLSQKTKDTIKPLIEELSALTAQFALGKGSNAARKRVADITKQVTDVVGSEKPSSGLTGLMEQAQKPETAPIKAVETADVIKDAKIKTVTEQIAETPKETNPLLEEAKKYKSAEEFVGKEFRMPLSELTPSQPSAKTNVANGSLSKNGVNPIDIEIGKNGEILVADGNHRYFEALARGDKDIRVRFPEYIKRIDRGELSRLKDFLEENVTDLYNQAKADVQKSQEGLARTLKPAESTGEKAQSKLASSVEERAVEKKLTDTFGDTPEYNKVNMKEQADLATKLLTDDPERARRIALGEELAPNNILPEAIFTALENKALKLGDVETLRDLATKSTLSTEATAMGQRIRALAERNPDTPVAKIMEVQKERSKKFEKKGTTVKQAKKDEVEKIKKKIKEAAPKVDEWESFIKEIQCNY